MSGDAEIKAFVASVWDNVEDRLKMAPGLRHEALIELSATILAAVIAERRAER